MTDVQVGTRIGPYRVEAVLPGNLGGFAQVVTARRVSRDGENEIVAIKIARTVSTGGVDSEAFARALGSEVETLRVLKHPGILRLFPIQLDDRRYSYMARADSLPGHPWYFVMEYLAGGTAEDLVRQRHVLEPSLAVEIAHQVGVALDYIHTSGYAHLDIKTTNIMFRQPLTPGIRPEAVLIDFGAAQKALRRAEVEAGALTYLPPERVQVLTGERPPEAVTNRSAADVYALGITLYCMLTGDLPFRGRRDHVTTAILQEAPTHPMQVNRDLVTLPDLDALIMQMLEKDPLRRPSTKEVLTRLDQAVPPPRFESVAQRLNRPSNANRGWKHIALALGAIAIIEGACLGLVWSQPPFIRDMLTKPTNTLPPGITTPMTPSTQIVPVRTIAPNQRPTATSTLARPEPTVVPTYTPLP